MSATLRQAGTHSPHVWSTNLCSWLSDKTSLPQIVDVQNELIFSVFVSFVLFECLYKLSLSHYIAQFTWFEMMPFHLSNLWIWNVFTLCFTWILSLSLSLQPVFVYKSTFENSTCDLFQPKLVAVVVTCILVTTGQTWWFNNPFKFQLKQIKSQRHMTHLLQNNHNTARQNRFGHSWPYSP